MRSVTTVNCAL